MENTFLVIFTLLFMFLHPYGESSNNIMITASSNVTCIQKERQSLLVFRQGLVDESNRLSTWTGVECCEWQGVRCDRRNGHVVKLDLHSPLSFMDDHTLNTSNWLEGKVSPSLLNLKHLLYLDLSMNNFSGQNIPEFFGSFKYLEYLNLSYSGFSGVVPPHLGNLSRLQFLDLNINYLYLINSYGVYIEYDNILMVKDDMRWVSSFSTLKHLDLSGITIGKHIEWFHPINSLPSLVTLNLALCDINIPSIKFINFTSINSLDISDNGINSTIPIWLSNLTSLVHLNLRGNSFHGRISEVIGTLTSLSSIDLSSNQLNTSMPNLFWNLSSLVHLDLSSNEIYGQIPPPLGGMSSLRVLSLFYNQLSGSIPQSIGLLASLQVLNFYGNQLNGSIPERIGLLTKLQELVLSSNQLSGAIPTCLGRVSNLQSLYLSGNQLSGNIPESIGQLSLLESLYLSDNQLSGSIPKSIGLLTKLQLLYVHRNQLSGNIPTSLGQLSNLKILDVTNNSLVGVVSEIHFIKLNNLTELYLSDNSLTLNVSLHWNPPFNLNYFSASSCNIGPQFPSLIKKSTDLEHLYLVNSSIRDIMPEWFENITSHIQILDMSYNQIGGNLPRIRNSAVQIVNLGKNHFAGSVPTHLCELLSIEMLDLSNNNISEVLPNCLGSLNQLRVMDLTSNNIMGDIPASLGSLSYLESLHLHRNKFEGNIPIALQNLTRLVIFDLGNNLLTGNIPSWIGKKLMKLKILNFQSNKLMGKIPSELCQNSDLQHLNLENNSITGTIPRCFCNLTGMIVSGVNFGYNVPGYGYEDHIEAYIKGIQMNYTKTLGFLISLDLSNNKMIGEIPDVLMNLVALNNLNLSRNLLSGHIPATIGNLKKMESLDLSTNKLSGPIPPSLANLNFLSCLNFSFNNLSGPIPVGNQLQILGDPSTIYEGNTELCGPSLSRSCKESNLSYAHASEDEENDGTEGCLWIYASVIPGFVVGFMGLISSLHLFKIWRITYFGMIENVCGFLMISVIMTLARVRRKFF